MFRINAIITYLVLVYGLIINPINGTSYPGLRRPPPPPLTSAEETNILSQFVEDLARRRFQQKLKQEQFYNHLNQQNQHGGPNPFIDEDYNSAPAQSFTYEFPEPNRDIETTGEIEFAVNPSDPRYYEGRVKNPNTLNDSPFGGRTDSDNLSSTKNMLSSYDTISASINKYNTANKEVNGKGIFANQNGNKSIKDILFNKVKPPMDINSKTTQSFSSLLQPMPFRGRDDIAKMVMKLQKEGNANAVINGIHQSPSPSHLLGEGQRSQEAVVKERVGDSDVSMYMVALLSGITAAVLVGFMALGIAWIILQRRTKAAADVDYPAYGVTGPNKDLSPSGDKRLAQSAQLYHYQHQKQQIIGMENRQTPEQTTGQSDVESDDENEEGDYTVYECPGLASTGEMEVKNPLFIDETPVSTPMSASATTVTSTTSTTAAGAGATTNVTNSPKHQQKLQNKPQSQQIQSVKLQQQPSNTSSTPASPTRSQSPGRSSPKSSNKREKQPPPTPQRKQKSGNIVSAPTSLQLSTVNGEGNDAIRNNLK